MLSRIVTTSISYSSLGSRSHARLLDSLEQGQIDAVLEHGKAPCHICGVKVPGYMEIDHLSGHKPGMTQGLKAICTFCHDLAHPLWAGARKRIIPVFAPDLSQEDISRMSWAYLARRGGDGFESKVFLADLEARRDRIRMVLDCDDAESLFEAAFTTRDAIGQEKAEDLFRTIDQILRFVPAVLFDGPLPPGGGLSTWDRTGFRDFATEAAEAARIADVPWQELEAMARAIEAGRPSP